MSRIALIRGSLWISFAFNLLAAYLFAVPDSPLGVLLGLPAPAPALYRALAAYLVALFGVCYGWLAVQEDPHQPLLAVGAVGKAGVFVIAAALWLAGSVGAAIVGLASGDLILALLWGWALLIARMAP